MLIKSLYEENEILLKNIEKITNERNMAQTKALINEQIS